jgi:hypothetical protein
MIIWKGYGILVLIITLAIAALFNSIFTGFGINGEMGAAIGVILSGIAIWYAGRWFNAPEKAQSLIDKKSGREILIKPDHSLFFIKMQYWAFIVGGIGMIMLIAIMINGKSPL